MNTDWSQFWPSMIATLAGFILALLGQWAAGKLHNYFQQRDLKARIKQELELVKIQLSDLTDTALDLQPLKTPTWDEAISAGQISILQADLRVYLFNVYSLIQEFNSWNRVQANYYFTNSTYNDLLTKSIKDLKERLLSNGDKKLSLDSAIRAIGGK